MNLSDSFYLALCMTVLILGVVYWFWTQNQYMQRKLNLLETIVYEMKTTFNTSSAPDAILDGAFAAMGGSSASVVPTAAPPVYAPPPAPLVEESLHDDLIAEELGFDDESGAAAPAPAATSATPDFTTDTQGDEHPDFTIDDTASPLLAGGGEDLQPGGAAGPAPTGQTAAGSMLEGMTLKELRRLADQKGVTGAKQLKKHELIEAIRNSKTAVTPFEITEGVLTLE
jgi:hypothetical protein